MSAKHVLNELVGPLSWLPGSYPSEGARHYLRTGGQIPDYLLPGRAIMRLSPEVRSELAKLTSDDVKDVAPWWTNVMCGK